MGYFNFFYLTYRGIKINGSISKDIGYWSADGTLIIDFYCKSIKTREVHVNKYKALKSISKKARELINESHYKNFSNFRMKKC